MPPTVTTKMAANDFLSFVNASPTPFHAVRSVKEKLTKAGFTEIKVSSRGTIDVPALIRRRRRNHGHQLASLVAGII